MTTTTRQIFFIDARVADYETLLAGLPEGSEGFLLDAEQDGIEQMARVLSGYSGLDSVQIISHGSSGTLYLGSTVLNNDNLFSYQNQLAAMGASLTETGDILLYGCNVAAGTDGVRFIQSLAVLTGADVAASNNLTGASGDWLLEVAMGAIESNLLLDADKYKSNLILTSVNQVIPATDLTSTPPGWSGTPISGTYIGADSDDLLEVNLIGDFVNPSGNYRFGAIQNATVTLGDGADTVIARSNLGSVGGGGSGSLYTSPVVNSVIDVGLGDDEITIGYGGSAYVTSSSAGGGTAPGLIDSYIALGPGDDPILST